MDYKEFVSRVANLLNSDKVEVNTTNVVKPNTIYFGLQVRMGENLMNCYNLSDYYSDYMNGRPFNDIVQKISEKIDDDIKQAKGNTLNGKNFINLIENYNQIKDRLYLEAINMTYNESYLETVPFESVGDIACIYRICLGEKNGEEISCVVTNSLLELWGIASTQLHDDAIKNAEIMKPMVIENMMTYGWSDSSFKIITNEKRTNGASAIFYDNFFETLEEVGIDECYLVPSSVHECLIFNNVSKWDENELQELLVQVNQRVVAENEVLANHIFKLNVNEKELVPVGWKDLSINSSLGKYC